MRIVSVSCFLIALFIPVSLVPAPGPGITGTWRVEQGGHVTITHVSANRYRLRIQSPERKMTVEAVLEDRVLKVRRAMITLGTITFAADGRTAVLKTPRGTSKMTRGQAPR